MGFSLSGAVAGAGGAAAEIGGGIIQENLRRETALDLEKVREAANIEREKRLEQAQIRAEARARQPMKDAAADIERAKTELVDDPSGTARPRNAPEIAEAEEAAYRKHGLINEAMRSRDSERQRQRDAMTDVARTRDDNRADAQVSETARHNKVMEGIQSATQGRLAALAKVQLESAQFDLKDKKDLRQMQTDYAAETDPVKRATLERNILTRLGKAKELPEPVKAYVDTVKAELTAYAKSEAEGLTLPPSAVQRRNELQRQMQNLATTGTLNIGAAAESQPSTVDVEGLRKRASNPAAVEFFEQKYGKGSAARFLGNATDKPAAAPGKAAPAAAPAAPKAADQRDYNPEMEKEDPELARLGSLARMAGDPTLNSNAYADYARRMRAIERASL